MKDKTISIGLFGLENFYDGSPRGYLEVAKIAEDSGIDYITITDHVVMGERTDRYPFGKFPVPLEYPWFEPISILSSIAAVTSTIKLSNGILIGPLRSAALLAKQSATLDVISNGRFELGIGTGWQREEYEASGLNFDQRLDDLDDQLGAFKELWASSPANFKGKHLTFKNIYSIPYPLQKEGIPIWFGMMANEENADRIAQHGVGWVPIQAKPDFIRSGKEILQKGFERAGRKTEELRIRGQLQMGFNEERKPCIDRTLENLEAGLEAGITDLEIFPSGFIQSKDDLPGFFKKLVDIKN
ncbi:MAG: TIGR03619 family F420-dependent LLM class oxidoreductase [SAR86 cluster bacterium]|nr:TIGR03619 family F420-dependent LLM class oxidoreductase [SAR86 cluster bacterium]